MGPSPARWLTVVFLAGTLGGCDGGMEGREFPATLADPAPAEAGAVLRPDSDSDAPPDRPVEPESAPAPAAAEAGDGDAVVSDPPPRPRFRRPEAIKGIYVNAWAAGSRRRLDALLEMARATEINTFVIDVKDVTGHVSHASDVPAARASGALNEPRILDMPGLLRRLEAEGIYPIARLVIIKDSVLSRARPDLAVQDTAGGIWIDSKGLTWLNLFQREVWDYHLDLAEEVARMGFPEIQWDYVRFPDAKPSDMARAVFPGDSGQLRTDAVRAFLGYAGDRLDALGLDVQMTADVFGVTTTYRRVAGIGQEWEKFIDRVDAAHPMVYPSHYGEGSHGMAEPNANPYEIVLSALEDAGRRSREVDGAGDVRPWLQDFTMGSPRYEAPEVRAQIQATYDAGFSGWILWNPSSRYSVGALEPVEGFDAEPLIRVGGDVVPVSERHAALERAAARLRQAAADSLERATAADSLGRVGDASDLEAAPADTLPAPSPGGGG
ncbi:MAG: putative glycoside hydrolase [Gemmatimonadota bacterium]